MQGTYRKVVRWIYPRYESSAWFRLAFLLTTVAAFQVFFCGMLVTFGDGYFIAAAVVAILFAYSWGVACILTPGQWIERP